MRISDGGFAPILACIASVTALAVAYEAASTLRSLKRLVHSGEEAISRAANGQRDEPSFTRQDGREGVLRRESKSREKLSRLRNGKGSQSTLDGLKGWPARGASEDGGGSSSSDEGERAGSASSDDQKLADMKNPATADVSSTRRMPMANGWDDEADVDFSGYVKIRLPEETLNEETVSVCKQLRDTCLELHYKWQFPAPHPRDQAQPTTGPYDTKSPLPNKWEGVGFHIQHGVVHIDDGNGGKQFLPPGSMSQFVTDVQRILSVYSSAPVRGFAHRRLMLLEQKFRLHLMVNSENEVAEQKNARNRDFYNVRKVDTHIHHSSAMTSKHLLRFMKSKLKKEPDTLVSYRDGRHLTLAEVFESLGLTSDDLNIDALDVHADKSSFHRFDNFGKKNLPFGQSRLREVFLKHDNLLNGRYLAEITKEVIDDLEFNKHCLAEYRISIYGQRKSELDTLAAWAIDHDVWSPNVIFMIQVPRLYGAIRKTGILESFQDMLSNIFEPLFEVTLDPSSHPKLHVFLQRVGGFDMVDDESQRERPLAKSLHPPEEWMSSDDPPYGYYAYYLYANLYALNKLRHERGMNMLPFRPHAGEAGETDHLAVAWLLADSIAHGNNLRRSPVLQYLYYLTGTGLSMSPLSNNSLFLSYDKNPFPSFFARGLNVTLSTDDPLQIHLTKEPLLEEYSVAAQLWKLSSCDICEIARNSVLLSSFPHHRKQEWVAEEYERRGPEGNAVNKTNVPRARLKFRHDVFNREWKVVNNPDLFCSRPMEGYVGE